MREGGGREGGREGRGREGGGREGRGRWPGDLHDTASRIFLFWNVFSLQLVSLISPALLGGCFVL